MIAVAGRFFMKLAEMPPLPVDPRVWSETGVRLPRELDAGVYTDLFTGDTVKPEGAGEGRRLKLTNLEKVLYPDAGFTKAQVIDYYTRIAPVLLPHTRDHPLTLKRYPNGVDGELFYEKNCPKHRPPWVQTATVWSGGNNRDMYYCLCQDLPTLVWLANLATLEMHTSLSYGDDLPTPRTLVFDLDPGPPATIVECCAVAQLLRPLLAERGLTALAKTSGGKGLQLVAALSGLTSEQATDLALGMAERLEHEHPAMIVSRMTKRLRPGKVLIDWSQNNAAKTTVAPYSLRAMARPTVSTPVTWDEVGGCSRPEDLVFTSDDVLERVAGHGDLLASLAA